jgi:hypothetical protein
MAPSSRRDVLLALAEEDVRVALRLADGTTREGWIAEVHEDVIVFEHAPSPFYAQAHGTDAMAPEHPERIAIAAITAYVGEEPGWRSFG